MKIKKGLGLHQDLWSTLELERFDIFFGEVVIAVQGLDDGTSLVRDFDNFSHVWKRYVFSSDDYLHKDIFLVSLQIPDRFWNRERSPFLCFDDDVEEIVVLRFLKKANISPKVEACFFKNTSKTSICLFFRTILNARYFVQSCRFKILHRISGLFPSTLANVNALPNGNSGIVTTSHARSINVGLVLSSIFLPSKALHI